MEATTEWKMGMGGAVPDMKNINFHIIAQQPQTVTFLLSNFESIPVCSSRARLILIFFVLLHIFAGKLNHKLLAHSQLQNLPISWVI